MLINFRYAVMPLSRYNVIYYIIYTALQHLSVYTLWTTFLPCNTYTPSTPLSFSLLQKPISMLS